MMPSPPCPPVGCRVVIVMVCVSVQIKILLHITLSAPISAWLLGLNTNSDFTFPGQLSLCLCEVSQS